MDCIDTFQLCDEIISQYELGLSNEVDDFFQFLEVFSTKYGELAKSIPYHINVIDELHVNENANSRILAALLQYNEGGDFTLLKSFVDFFLQDQNIRITQPIITSENLRIDLLVREPGKNAIIFENKIYGAVLQKNQIARYILKMRKEGYKDEQIHVVFLPPTGEYQTNECSWKEPDMVCETCDCSNCNNKNKSLKEAFIDRFTVVTFREGIIEWLKEAVIPNCRQKEVYLYTAAKQYLDYLEGYFDLRTTNNKMNMELQQLISKKLELEGKNHEQQLEILKQRENEIQHLLNQMRSLKESTRQIIFEEWKQKVKTQYHDLHPMEKGEIVDVTIEGIEGRKVTVLINKDGQLYCQVQFDNTLPKEERTVSGTKIMRLKDILPEPKNNENDCVWKYFDEFDCEATFKLFEEVVERCKQLVD